MTLHELAWQVGCARTRDGEPDRWIPASVPGAVQLDYALFEGWEPYYRGEHWRDYAWMEDLHWVYRASFRKPEGAGRVFFSSKGIDYSFRVILNGRELHRQEGMFAPIDLDLTDHLFDDNELRIALDPVPKAAGAPADRRQAAASCKPAVSYGWDWHPRLIPLGIWDETGLALRGEHRLETVDLRSELDGELRCAHVALAVSGAGLDGCTLRWELRSPAGDLVLGAERPLEEDRVELDGAVEPVELWWPNGHGRANLYRSIVTLRERNGRELDRNEQRIGFRTVRLVMNEGAWREPERFPKSRSHPPITLEVNGRRIFAKGSNWVNPEIFPGMITRRTYAPLIELAVGAHFNLLRVWGGGIVNKESFYELCDERGLMVWQEFPLACNAYPDDPRYLAVLEREATAIIERLRRHASLVIWCGGNELFNEWSGMTDQSRAIRLLDALCLRLDRSRPFLPTSPLDGMGHGHYVFADPANGGEVFQWMADSHCTAYTEFGCPGPASEAVLREFLREEELFPPSPQSPWKSHHAFDSWHSSTWLCLPIIEHYFGLPSTLQELIEWGQLLQSAGYACIFEEARRQKPYCSMALNWCFNEPWPTAANCSLVSWPARPKPALRAAAAACRPALASARVRRFAWRAGERFACELFLLNDSPDPIPAGAVRAVIRANGRELEFGVWHFDEVPPNRNLAGPELTVELPAFAGRTFDLALTCEGRPELDSSYPFVFHDSATK